MFCTGEILRNSRHWSVRQAVWHQLNLSSVRMVWEDMVFIITILGCCPGCFIPSWHTIVGMVTWRRVLCHAPN